MPRQVKSFRVVDIGQDHSEPDILARHELLTGRLVPDFGEPAAYFLVEISRLRVRDSMGSSSMRNRKGQGAASRGPGPRVLYESVAECVAGESEG